MAEAQYEALPHVPRGAERPGDLIFFGPPGGIYHVGIYAGGGQMWVAPHSGDVVRKQAIWTSAYLVARVP